MGIVIYSYKANPLQLAKKYPGAQVQSELLPLPAPGVHLTLEDLVDRRLKKPTTIVVGEFKELGDRLEIIQQNIGKITGANHTIKIDSKDLTFESLEQFNTYFKEFLDLFDREESKERPGRPEVLTEDMKTMARGLRGLPKPMPYREIADKLTQEFGRPISHEVVYGYIKRLQVLDPVEEE